MKKSNYNIFIKKKNCVLGYNTITDSYVVISHTAYKNFINENCIDTFQEKFPTIYKSFKTNGFIIDDSFEELNSIRFDNRVETFSSKEYFLMVYPTQDCNLKCLNCVMLPQCMGPCSQKQMENGWGNIEEICSLNVIDLSIEDYLTLDFEVRNLIYSN